MGKITRGLLGKEEGFTTMELLIVLALFGILVAIAVPNLGGFLGRSKERAWESDRRALQSAVDAYYNDVAHKHKFPTSNGTSGDTPSTAVYINADHLVSEGYLKDVPRSASANNAAAGTGSYSWYVDSKGQVKSWSPSGTDYVAGQYP